ncbi:MAG: ornithine cyclodeaminase [Comamonadaceae bacterium]|nr:ornithine cyclodeaminase [Comamonadaceae bacterium]
MTQLIDLPCLARLVREVGPAPFLAGLSARIKEAFRRWPAFAKSARLAHHGGQGVIELMPVCDGTRYSFKYVNGHPGNPAQGLPTVMAFGVLADMATGMPLMLAEATLLTALRTAATSALAARLLARPGSRRMALIGNGAQGEFQALAVHALLGINDIALFDTDPGATAKLRANLAPWAPALRLRAAASVPEAVRGADIVTTATAALCRAQVLTPALVEPGMHLNAVGGDSPGKTELAPEVVRAARVIVEYAPQTRREGEIQQLAADHPVTELWRILAGEAPGRTCPEEVTLFDSVGFALEDHAALDYVYQLAQERGLGRDVALVPGTGAPKDLFARTLGNSP